MRKLMTGVVALLAATALLGALVGSAGAAAHGSHAKSKTSALDEEWTTAAMQGDLFEIKGGEIAQKQGQNPAVKALGKRLSSDHSEAFAEGRSLARKLGIEVPDEPTYPEQWELQTVGEMTGAGFDKHYTGLERLDHKQDIEDAKTEIEDGSNPAVIRLAKMDLKMYREHLKLVVKTEGELSS